MKVRTRFAPSPTGYLHIGGLRSALYAYAFAKSRKGTFVLRIEDTDRNRFVPRATEKLIEQLKIFGLNWDEGPIVGGPFGPYVQSERVASGIYAKNAEKLLASGHAFRCFCPPQTEEEIKEAHAKKIVQLRDNNCRNLSKAEIEKKLAAGEKPAIRLKVPDNETVSYRDFVVGKEIKWNTDFVDDVMLLKSDGFPTYQLAVVVDDAAMEMTHIIRAMEWLPSTPVHILLFNYLGFAVPEIGHLTDILDPGGGKLSKRKGNVSTEDFINMGYLPDAILNFIMLLGWAPKDNRELYSLSEFVEAFQNGQLQVNNPGLNMAKLDWFNQQYIRKLDDKELAKTLVKFSSRTEAEIKKFLPLVRDRLAKLSDFDDLTGFLVDRPKIDQGLFATAKTAEPVKVINHAKEKLSEKWDGQILEEKARKYCAENGVKVGDYFMILRVAVTGRTATPPLWDIMKILGQEEVLKRLELYV